MNAEQPDSVLSYFTTPWMSNAMASVARVAGYSGEDGASRSPKAKESSSKHGEVDGAKAAAKPSLLKETGDVELRKLTGGLVGYINARDSGKLDDLYAEAAEQMRQKTPWHIKLAYDDKVLPYSQGKSLADCRFTSGSIIYAGVMTKNCRGVRFCWHTGDPNYPHAEKQFDFHIHTDIDLKWTLGHLLKNKLQAPSTSPALKMNYGRVTSVLNVGALSMDYFNMRFIKEGARDQYDYAWLKYEAANASKVEDTTLEDFIDSLHLATPQEPFRLTFRCDTPGSYCV